MNRKESFTHSILTSVAEFEDVDVLDLPVLFDSIDGDVLESLLAGFNGDFSVTFSYSESVVTISDGDEIEVSSQQIST